MAFAIRLLKIFGKGGDGMSELRKSKYGAMILPDGKYYSLNDMETRLNNNVLVVGTTGVAKTRTVITPNLLECVGS